MAWACARKVDVDIASTTGLSTSFPIEPRNVVSYPAPGSLLLLHCVDIVGADMRADIPNHTQTLLSFLVAPLSPFSLGPFLGEQYSL
jgi:hypothetical protein